MRHSSSPAPLNIVLLGDPAAGKATQAKRLVARYRLHDFDIGKRIRALARHPKLVRRYRLHRTMQEGKLTPTVLARRIMRETLDRVPRSRGILFDGHPKMLGEAKLMAHQLGTQRRADPLVVYLSIPFSEVVRRAEKRGRSDDQPNALRNRIAYYRVHMAAAVRFYRRRYAFRKVSGIGTRDAVFARLRKVIDAYSASSS